MSAWELDYHGVSAVNRLVGALKAASSQQIRLAVRSAISCACAGLIAGAPYQGSLSLFEPPGIFKCDKQYL